jgi:AraC family transcriptional activator of pobA
VEHRFRGNQVVSDYAASLHVSESRLRTACIAATAQSPIQLIHARILLEAKHQPHFTDSPVREIAFALGFEDAAYFTRFFRRRGSLAARVSHQGAGSRAGRALTPPVSGGPPLLRPLPP